jgi:hypothetical protein
MSQNNYVPLEPKTPVTQFTVTTIDNTLYNRTFTKPLPPRGRLLNSTFYPVGITRDIKYNTKALVHGINGKANDHELGKLNDMGMLAGAAAIAAYLFKTNKTPLTKGMEIVGPAAFFASMALWPKLAIQLPAMIIHGVDPMKQYKDSQGRVKPFYQDPQFIPWDLYSDKAIDRIGDRLGVSKEMPNRRAYTEEKMRKIALQSNTLWMLTAGFATPLMTALACNRLEKPLAEKLDEMTNKQADNILKNFAANTKKLRDPSIAKEIKQVIADYTGKNADENAVQRIAKILTKNETPMMTDLITQDLENLIKPGQQLPVKQLRRIVWSMRKFKSEQAVLKQYYTKKLGNVPESALANFWNETSDKIVDLLGFTKEEYKQLDRKNVGKLLRGKLEKIVSNDADYKLVLGGIAEQILQMNKKFGIHQDEKTNQDWMCCTDFVRHTKQAHNLAGHNLRKAGMEQTSKVLDYETNSLKHAMLETAHNRVYGVKNELFRWIETLDFFKRAKDMDPKIAETAKTGKKILIEGHTADYMTKFEDSLKRPHNLVEYQDLMKNMYPLEIKDGKWDFKLDKQTDTILEAHATRRTFVNKYLKDMIEKFGNEVNFVHPKHLINGEIPEGNASPSLKKFLLAGVAEDEYIFKALKSKYNSQKWLKMFGKFAAILTGVTVGAQFFFGKVRKPMIVQQEVKK